MNVKLNYEEKGQGFPLIMLHGNRQNLTYFKNQIDFFSKKYKVIAIDTRGHGRSPAGNAPCTIRQFADDLNDFMEQKNIEKAHILGFSDGGNTAAVFALNHSEKIGKLILSGANLDPSGVKEYFRIPALFAYRFLSLFKKRKCVDSEERSVSCRQKNREANIDSNSKAKQKITKIELLSLIVNEPNIKPEELMKIKAPALVIAGTHDLIKDSHTRLIASSLPDSRIVFIGGGHSLARLRPEKFNETVNRFLEE